jgi:hypothetical protein
MNFFEIELLIFNVSTIAKHFPELTNLLSFQNFMRSSCCTSPPTYGVADYFLNFSYSSWQAELGLTSQLDSSEIDLQSTFKPQSHQAVCYCSRRTANSNNCTNQ